MTYRTVVKSKKKNKKQYNRVILVNREVFDSVTVYKEVKKIVDFYEQGFQFVVAQRSNWRSSDIHR